MLPPSETKSPGGDGPPLDLARLACPELGPVRSALVDVLAQLCQDLAAARTALKVSASKDDELRANTRLSAAGTLPAVKRYTGVLYEALDIGSLPAAARGRAHGRILIASALWGVVGAADHIPAYRLSAGSRLPGMGTLASVWKPSLVPALTALADGRPLLDLRSGSYAALAPLAAAIGVRVVTEHDDGSRTVVSHFNKATKGLLARVVVSTRRDLATPDDVVAEARRHGLQAEQTGPAAIEIVT